MISEKLQVIDERIFQQHTLLNRINDRVSKSNLCEYSTTPRTDSNAAHGENDSGHDDEVAGVEKVNIKG